MRKIRKSMAAVALSMAMITTAAVPWEPAMVVQARKRHPVQAARKHRQ